MSEYPKSVWDLLERIEPAGLVGLPVDDLPADVLKAAELAGLVRVFNKWPGPKVVYMVSANAPRDRSYIPPRPMPDPVRMVGLTPAGLEALTARRCDEALAALEPSTGEPATRETKPRPKREAAEHNATGRLIRNPYMTASEMAGKMECSPSYVKTLKIWKANQKRLADAKWFGKDPSALDLIAYRDGERFDGMTMIASNGEPDPAEEAERREEEERERLRIEQYEDSLTDNPTGPQRPVRKRV